jgi:hypothetical protein
VFVRTLSSNTARTLLIRTSTSIDAYDWLQDVTIACAAYLSSSTSAKADKQGEGYTYADDGFGVLPLAVNFQTSPSLNDLGSWVKTCSSAAPTPALFVPVEVSGACEYSSPDTSMVRRSVEAVCVENGFVGLLAQVR